MPKTSSQTSDVCRGCLARGRRMCNVISLKGVFRDLTGINISVSDKLPQRMCYECSALLQKFGKFRTKVLKSHYWLSQYMQNNIPFPYQEVESPHLAQTNVLYFDVFSDQVLKVEDEPNQTVERDTDSGMSVLPTTIMPNVHTVAVKQEPVSYKYEVNITKDGWCEIKPQEDITSKPSTSRYIDLKNVCTMPANTEQQIISSEPREDTAVEDIEVKVKLESCDEENITIEEWCYEDHQNKLTSKSFLHTPKHDERTLQKKISCHESHFVSETSHQPLRAQLHLGKDISNRAFAIPGVATQRKDHTDRISTRHSDDNETEIEQIDDGSSVNSKHGTENVFKCDICGKCYSHKSSLKTHIVTVHIDGPYKCEVCMQTFIDKQKLKVHYRIHNGEKPFTCDVCRKGFREKRLLKRHYHVHDDIKTYECDVCAKCFRHENSLRKHTRMHTADQPYKCDVCNKSFVEKRNLTRHYRIHTGEKPYKCDVCMKCFRTKGGLTIHFSAHTDERPYKCDLCKKCFKRKDNLTQHYRIHVREHLTGKL